MGSQAELRGPQRGGMGTNSDPSWVSPARASSRVPRCRLAVGIFLAFSACGDGGFAIRDVRGVSGSLPVETSVRIIRVEADTGSYIVQGGTASEVAFDGVVRRAAQDEAGMQRLLQVDPTPRMERDPAHPDRLLLRMPGLPPDASPLHSMLTFEVRFVLPDLVDVEVVVRGSGHLTAEDRRGSTRLDTARGDLRLARCHGSARLHTGKGTTIVFDHRGDLEVEAEVGEVQAFVPQPGERLTLATGLGNVMVFLPPEAGFRVDARALRGKIASAFGQVARRVQDYGAVLEGTHGDGRTSLVIRTGSGQVAVNRRNFR